jgi:hypothetical protein
MPFEQRARDIRHAARGLWRDRPFTPTTVSTLTVAIALVTVVFTIFNAYVLRPYAVRDPYSLYEVRWHTRPAGGSGTRWTQAGRTFRWSDYQELQRHGEVFDAVIAERNRSVTVEGNSLLAAFTGAAIGVTLSFAALAPLRAAIDLKNVSILDPAAFAAATAILLLAWAVAAYLPSRQATHRAVERAAVGVKSEESEWAGGNGSQNGATEVTENTRRATRRCGPSGPRFARSWGEQG